MLRPEGKSIIPFTNLLPPLGKGLLFAPSYPRPVLSSRMKSLLLYLPLTYLFTTIHGIGHRQKERVGYGHVSAHPALDGVG